MAAPGRDEAETVPIPGGGALVGTDQPFFREDGEGPARRVTLAPFRMDVAAVTNRRFAAFVDATGYRTGAVHSPSGPLALKRTTQSRTTCRVTLPSRAASERVPPS
nr:SUMF1/EgtB/PvdO family nonheme iron enzyme [Roseomonas sp. MO-31]